ncbi:hypothetical protein I302_106624 [Kwoniella bestiolae CBS 10118]|uniref:SEC7 domain-containing protein n=1 Tax=Kwoniella bestiolae CBS 10118 TaxID=1296100 RepID=A0A1B9G0W2_9TREE|nr:hypothetical protein I302_06114 [Kwoniella bestiolae CBS 10118]OCF24653.1 hypothetical protein I302_06114 [Kwoniella bestiolae CBS 10118]
MGSPTKQHFYASRPSSRAGSRPTSPPTPAEVRSQAVAKIKRAASLPRRPDGRRPSLAQAINVEPNVSTAQTIRDQTQDENTLDDQQQHAGPSTSTLDISPNPSEAQEVLSPSPVATTFDHHNMYPSPTHTPGAAMQMQRSVSANSTYHMTSPIAPYTPPAADWAAMQLAQSYLPSLTPTGLSPSPYPHSVPIGGRNTPSPLPTLGELATLQRSNSNAARAHAMSKLTGGKDAPQSEEDFTLSTPSRVNLTRAGTLGGTRMLGLAINKSHVAAEDPVQHTTSDMTLTEARPRLQRSFTVSSSNMGEERRSAVGRRMVERLAERRAARQKEEEEVRKLWEERRAQVEVLEAEQNNHQAEEQDILGEADNDDDGDYDEYSGEQEHEDRQYHEDDENRLPQLGNEIPSFARHSPLEPAQPTFTPGSGADLLVANAAVGDRPISRGTMVSSQEPFEYEDHLRRSLSSRTARTAMGTADPLPSIVTPEHDDGQNTENLAHSDVQVSDEPLLPPKPSYATPTRPNHQPHSSTSTESTIQGSQSPGGSTLSGLDSMMFVMGGSSLPGSAGLKPHSNGQHWPQEVHEGSEWGTPAKDLHQATFTDSPILHSPAEFFQPQVPSQEEAVDDESNLTPPSRSTTRTDSMMSWEEVGGREDQEIRVPTDKTYHQKSGSFSAKLKGSVRSAMKKRSQSRTSITSSTTSPPASPMNLQPATFSRRESESSTTPSYSKEHSPRHQPSVSSLSPSIAPDPQAALLLQHQLSNDPSQVSFLPRANLNDPRIMSAKLSPFPGIAQLERKNTDGSVTLGEPPKLIHQVSDSAVPSQQRATPPVVQESIYALPLPTTHPDDKRASADSATRRNWLSKAFGHSTSPRSSGSVSRKSSSPDVAGEARTLGQGAQIISSDVDPFAPPPPPQQNLGVKPSRHRSASPSVSVVPEVSEEGSRFTRFISMRGENNKPALLEHKEEELEQRSKDVLTRMDAVLALGPDDPARPEILDDPPRKLLLSTQILQVVNTHTVKDRYLFLFNDILVIAKPIISHGIHATLDMKYIVKSIVSLDKLAISGFNEEPTAEPPRHPVVTNFIERFAQDPVSACAYLVERSNPKVDTATLASLIFKTPELDKTQVGYLLAHNDKLMRHFIDRFNFLNIRIDEALRMFLLSIRLPTEPTSCETLLRGFGYRYFEANQTQIAYDRDLAAELVLAIIQFNDSLYGTFGFSLPNHAITKETFTSAFQSKDPRGLVPVDLLSDIYGSIKGRELVQSLDPKEESKSSKKIDIHPRRPSKLSYNVWSEKITISIPAPDPAFKIQLLGEGLVFDTPLLDFARASELSFRVKGTSLGVRHLSFNRIGSNAALYGNLGNTRLFTVERAFMKYTFHVSFISHLGIKRKYCFSLDDLESKRRWGKLLSRQIQLAKQVKTTISKSEIRRTAENVSIQVLRDALIPLEYKASPGHIENITDTNNTTSTNGGVEHRGSESTTKEKIRSGSVSISYTKSLKEEYDLGPLVPTKSTHPPIGLGGVEKQSGIMDVQTGKELVLLCRQNSLLPGLLELLHSAKEVQIPVGEGVERNDSVKNKGVRV